MKSCSSFLIATTFCCNIKNQTVFCQYKHFHVSLHLINWWISSHNICRQRVFEPTIAYLERQIRNSLHWCKSSDILGSKKRLDSNIYPWRKICAQKRTLALKEVLPVLVLLSPCFCSAPTKGSHNTDWRIYAQRQM